MLVCECSLAFVVLMLAGVLLEWVRPRLLDGRFADCTTFHRICFALMLVPAAPGSGVGLQVGHAPVASAAWKASRSLTIHVINKSRVMPSASCDG